MAMDFVDVLNQFSSRTKQRIPQIQTEEATKTAIIMPFFQQVLGYDVFNPDEFVPEFTADVGTKKGEKVDYAIFLDGEPVILVEAKWCGQALDKHASQLFRYFTTTSAKFAILTNGIMYHFYTDLSEKNKMDLEPFLVFDIFNIDENVVAELKRFAKSTLDIEAAFEAASELKYMNKIKGVLDSLRTEPMDSFVKYIMGEIYEGRATQKAIDEFRPIVKRGFNHYINDAVNKRLKAAMENSSEKEKASDESVSVDVESSQIKVAITQEEMEAFAIIKSILRDMCDVDRLTYRHMRDYMAVLFDDSIQKRICRFWLKGKQKYITTPDVDKKPVRHPDLESLNDIYKYSEHIREVCGRFLAE